MSTTQELKSTNFAVIVCSAHIQRSAAETWQRIGGFNDAGKFLNVQSELISSQRGIGAVRKIADSILEVMVGETRYSYSYAQIQGPMAHLAYHGCVSVSEGDGGSSDLTYTISYDQTLLSEQERKTQFDRLSQRFQGAASTMKLEAERSHS